jgi:hypothetical protein
LEGVPENFLSIHLVHKESFSAVNKIRIFESKKISPYIQ